MDELHLVRLGVRRRRLAVPSPPGAVSAGIEVELDLLENAAGLTASSAARAFTLPVAVFRVAIWLIMFRGHVSARTSTLFLVAAVLVVACGVLPIFTVSGVAVSVVLAVAVLERDRVRQHGEMRRV